MKGGLIVGACCAAAPATAQERAAFTGPSIGAGVGYLEHHFGLEVEESRNGEVVSRRDFYERSHGVDAVAWDGYE